MAGFVAELIGALFVGLWLLLFERHHDFGVFFDGLGTQGDGSYLGAFLAASLLGLYLFYGFEACGDVAEEVPDPGATIPKAMRRTIYVGGAAALLITAALILAQPDFNAIISGEQADPVGAVLSDVFGTVGSKIITVIVLISFVSCVLSLQAAASRLIYSYARDQMVFASDALSRFSPGPPRPADRADRRRRCPPRSSRSPSDLLHRAAEGHLLRLRGHLHRVPAGRAGGADRPQQRLDPERQVHARPLGPRRQHRRADLRRRRRAEPRVAARSRTRAGPTSGSS